MVAMIRTVVSLMKLIVIVIIITDCDDYFAHGLCSFYFAWE